MKTYKLDARAGSNFFAVSDAAKQIAVTNSCIVEFIFNEITCLVDSNTNLDLLYRDYKNAQIQPIFKNNQ